MSISGSNQRAGVSEEIKVKNKRLQKPDFVQVIFFSYRLPFFISQLRT
jgi:hypothetical protein